MGQSAAETVREIEQTRERLGDELEELEVRLPAGVMLMKRVAKIAAGGGVAGSVFWFAVRRRKGKKAARRADAPVEVHVDLVPARLADALESERARTWMMGAGAAWLLLRLAELRQLRKLRRATLA